MLLYTDHARKRMRERNVSKKEVEICLAKPDITYTDKEGNHIHIAHLETGRRIKVVTKKGSINPTIIITVAD